VSIEKSNFFYLTEKNPKIFAANPSGLDIVISIEGATPTNKKTKTK